MLKPNYFISEKVKSYIQNFISEENGQAITEYGAILAFVAVLITLLFPATIGSPSNIYGYGLSNIIAQAFNNLSISITRLIGLQT